MMTTYRPVALGLVLAVLAALLFTQINIPLPWLIGPLFGSAVARMANVDIRCPRPLREAGQWVIGTTLGLYFTSAVCATLAAHAGYIVLGVVYAILLGMACAWLLVKLSGADRTTAFFAMAIGGASEMAVQGDRHGGRVDQIAASHGMRMMLVVAIIPLAFQYSGVRGMDPFVPGTRVVDTGGLLLLVLITAGGALLLKRIGWANSWIIGPLLATALVTGNDINLSAMPQWALRLGQLFIGFALGARFSPQFVHTAPRFLGSVLVCTLLAMAVSVGFGLFLASISDIAPATAILATSPGGIAEMALTAQVLQLGVPIVTTFHVIRMTAIVLLVGPLFRRLHKRAAKPPSF